MISPCGAGLLLLLLTPAGAAAPAVPVQSAATQVAVSEAQGAEARRARDVLTKILSQRAFRQERAASWQTDLKQRAAAWLSDLWERTIGRRVAPRRVAMFLAWIAGLGAVAVLAVWLARLGARRRAEPLLSVGSIPAPRLPGHLLGQQAARLIRDGDVREGARVAYRAAVHRLEEEGAFSVDAARTPREYLRLLPHGHRRSAALAALTSTFERIWYASRAVQPGEGDRILALLQDLGCLSFDRPR